MLKILLNQKWVLPARMGKVSGVFEFEPEEIKSPIKNELSIDIGNLLARGS
jgi:hypothetical protein